jgi:magnesium-transporting ATPase (P-type)
VRGDGDGLGNIKKNQKY